MISIGTERAALIELARRAQVVRAIRDELHPAQRAVSEDPSQFKALLCGRRSGKTELDARAIAVALEECGPEEWVTYAAVTRALAKDLIWTRLEGLNARHKLGWTLSEHEGLVETPRGGRFRVLGFDKLPELQKTRGYKLRLAVFDEPATYQDRLETLIKDCVGPALADLRGRVIINGTPGVACVGFWHAVSTGLNPTYRAWHWTVRDNPKFPRDADAMLADTRRDFRWGIDDPTYRREWMAEWVHDPSALVYPWVPGRNEVDALPSDYDRATWIHTLGVDFGYSPEPSAWAVLASHPNRRDIVIVHSEEHLEQLPDEAAATTKRLVDAYRPAACVGDNGGSGKAYVEEWNRRWGEASGCTMEPADKLGKPAHIAVMGGEIRAGRVQAVKPLAPSWCAQASQLPWLDSARRHEHPAYPNHSTDAALYAFTRHQSYWHKAAPAVVTSADELAVLARRQRAARAAQARTQSWVDRV